MLASSLRRCLGDRPRVVGNAQVLLLHRVALRSAAATAPAAPAVLRDCTFRTIGIHHYFRGCP